MTLLKDIYFSIGSVGYPFTPYHEYIGTCLNRTCYDAPRRTLAIRYKQQLRHVIIY